MNHVENLSAAARYARIAFMACALAYAACIVVQVFLAGMSLFAGPEHWGQHVGFARLFAPLPLLIAVLAFAGKLSRGLRWLAVAMFLMNVLQFMTPHLESRMVAAAHTVIAGFLFWASVAIAIRSLRKSA